MKKIGNKKVLETFLEDLGQERREDEKTAKEICDEAIAAGHSVTLNAVRARLQRLCDIGKLTSRKTIINGRLTNLYSEP
jgi:hypothetical protein